jgi:hypothetical protein
MDSYLEISHERERLQAGDGSRAREVTEMIEEVSMY